MFVFVEFLRQMSWTVALKTERQKKKKEDEETTVYSLYEEHNKTSWLILQTFHDIKKICS